MKDGEKIFSALRAAFPFTIPIMTGFCFLGMAYGIYMNVLGFGVLYPALMAALIFGGSLEFIAATMLLSPFAPLQTFAVAVMIQARHLFYGLAMLEKYKGLGLKRQYLIFGLCDETFAINYSARIPEGIDRGWFYFFVTLLNQSYWVMSAMLGGLLGELLTFDTTGLGFVMTAMYDNRLMRTRHVFDARVAVSDLFRETKNAEIHSIPRRCVACGSFRDVDRLLFERC